MGAAMQLNNTITFVHRTGSFPQEDRKAWLLQELDGAAVA